MTDPTWNIARTYINQSGGLAGRSKLAGIWGVSRQRVAQLTEMPGFPKPVDWVSYRETRGGLADDQPVWLVDEANAWREEFYPG